MLPEEPRWRTLLVQIRSTQMELKRRWPEREVGLAGHPAAPLSAVRVAELRMGRTLPPSYRDFLQFSDGWPRFFEGASLLGTSELGRGSVPSRALSPCGSSALLPFAVARGGTAICAFDTTKRDASAELPVVAWVAGLGVECIDFTEFLSTVLELCRAELADGDAGSIEFAAALRSAS